MCGTNGPCSPAQPSQEEAVGKESQSRPTASDVRIWNIGSLYLRMHGGGTTLGRLVGRLQCAQGTGKRAASCWGCAALVDIDVGLQLRLTDHDPRLVNTSLVGRFLEEGKGRR